VFLTLNLVMFGWSTRSAAIGRRHTTLAERLTLCGDVDLGGRKRHAFVERSHSASGWRGRSIMIWSGRVCGWFAPALLVRRRGQAWGRLSGFGCGLIDRVHLCEPRGFGIDARQEQAH
jgi:hypothetical protein